MYRAIRLPDRTTNHTPSLIACDSTLEVSHIMRYINLLTYLLAYLSVPCSVKRWCGRSLRSTDALCLFVPRTCSEAAKRAFSVVAHNVWNSLPIDIRNTDWLSVHFS